MILFRQEGEREKESTNHHNFGRRIEKRGERQGGEAGGTTAIWESNISDDLTAPFRRNIRNCGRVIDGQRVRLEDVRGEPTRRHPLRPSRARLKGRRR